MKNKLLIACSIVIVLVFVGVISWYLRDSKTATSGMLDESRAIEVVKNQFPELAGYPSDTLPPRSIKTEKAERGWYVAFVQEGSGRPILDARCFLVNDDKSIRQRKYIDQGDAIAGEFSAKECRVMERIVGGDGDEHGCIGSAGYSWCEEKQKCLRIWEESCGEAPGDSSCGLETCHGLDIVCGAHPAEVCTEMYMVGDRCLQYAKCGVQNGICQQVENPQFTACAFCVQKCIEANKNDTSKLFECESNCNF